jgi:hypothetical protein
MKSLLPALVTLGLLGAPSRADTWSRSSDTLTGVSPSGGYKFTAVTKPAGPGYRTRGTLARVGKGGETTVWERELVNEPLQILVADDGRHVVTIDTFMRAGYDHSVVVYGEKGGLIADLKLEDLLSREEIDKHVEQSVSSRWWSGGARFTIRDKDQRLVVRLKWGKEITVALDERKPLEEKCLPPVGGGRPLSETLSAQTLNATLVELLKLQERGQAGPDVPLSAELFGHLHVMRAGGAGDVGLLRRAGRLPWPEALRAPAFEADRKRVSVLLPEGLKQAREGKVRAETVRELGRSVEGLGKELVNQVAELSPSQYIAAKRFHLRLEGAVAVLGEKDVQGLLEAADGLAGGGRTVAKLVRYMGDKGLRFAPALEGDEAAYAELQRAFAAYAEKARPPREGK